MNTAPAGIDLPDDDALVGIEREAAEVKLMDESVIESSEVQRT